MSCGVAIVGVVPRKPTSKLADRRRIGALSFDPKKCMGSNGPASALPESDAARKWRRIYAKQLDVSKVVFDPPCTPPFTPTMREWNIIFAEASLLKFF